MKKGVFVVLFGLLAMMGSATVALAGDEAAPTVRFDRSLVEAIDCADARTFAADFSSRRAAISAEDARAGARAFIACERTRRSDIEKTNLLRVLAAASLVVAASAENDGQRIDDLSTAQDVLKRFQHTINLTSRTASSSGDGVAHFSVRGGMGDERFERIETFSPTPRNFAPTSAFDASPYDQYATSLLAAIATLKK